jgi:putative FmdB family regulatory protein
MPTYEYKCRDCGETLEVVQSFTDDALTECPNCEIGSLKKVFAAPGIAFKGDGFYKTDSRSGSESKSGSSSSSSGDSDSSSSDSSDSSSKDSSSDKGSSSSDKGSSSSDSKSSSSDSKSSSKKDAKASSSSSSS